MSTLLDTNILTRLVQTALPLHTVTVDALAELRRRGEVLCIVPQNLYEFWVVGTRPTAQNGLGLSPAQAQTELVRLKGLFSLFVRVMPAQAVRHFDLPRPSSPGGGGAKLTPLCPPSGSSS